MRNPSFRALSESEFGLLRASGLFATDLSNTASIFPVLLIRRILLSLVLYKKRKEGEKIRDWRFMIKVVDEVSRIRLVSYIALLISN